MVQHWPYGCHFCRSGIESISVWHMWDAAPRTGLGDKEGTKPQYRLWQFPFTKPPRRLHLLSQAGTQGQDPVVCCQVIGPITKVFEHACLLCASCLQRALAGGDKNGGTVFHRDSETIHCFQLGFFFPMSADISSLSCGVGGVGGLRHPFLLRHEN